jgi:flavin reductase (DIM6/NTAB) family NADH-FMN oxidoreductase RutF
VFSGKEKGPQRFATGDWQAGHLDIPYLVDAQASVFCKVDRQMSYGSHTIFVGAVQGIRISETISPLIYQDGKFFRTVALAP